MIIQKLYDGIISVMDIVSTKWQMLYQQMLQELLPELILGVSCMW